MIYIASRLPCINIHYCTQIADHCFLGRSTQFHAIKLALLPREHSWMALGGVVTDSNSPSQSICLNSDMLDVV
jgi:hypothetical protein